MQEHLLGLNNMQIEAVKHTEGPLLIIAGAGAGKTKTITHRIIHLILDGTKPEKILAVTFTNKAAKEMKDRITNAIDKFAKTKPEEFFYESQTLPFVSTFHSLGVSIIKENARLLNLNKYFTILDENDSLSLIKEIIKESDLDPKQYEARKFRNIISRQKGDYISKEEYKQKRADVWGDLVAEIWQKYEDKKEKEGSLDFDDLLLKSVELLEQNPSVRETYQNRWQYIHIDEYQDTNEIQYRLSKILSEKHKNIAVIGDNDQCIYEWRGANLKNILNFEKDYPNAKVIMLEQNYRSTQNILALANEVIKKNQFRPDKNLFTKNKEGEKISTYEALDEKDEADFVATKILEILDSEDQNALNNIAVLYRANFQSRVLEEAMLKYNIPYQVLGTKFFERKEVKDIIAYLRLALNKDSLSDFKRIINFPKRGIGKVALTKIFAKEEESLPQKTREKLNDFYAILHSIKEKIKTDKAGDVIKFVIKKTGIEQELLNGDQEDLERLENIKELASLALKYDNLENGLGIEKLIEDGSLYGEQDSLVLKDDNTENKKEKNGIKLMTIHASKGLEFDTVFVVGLEEGLFPSQRDGETGQKDSEEERRLFYVAITRARKKLFLSFANFRTIFGSKQINTISSFLYDLPEELLEREGGSLLKTIYI